MAAGMPRPGFSRLKRAKPKAKATDWDGISEKITAAVFVFLSAAVVFYGDGDRDLITIVRTDERISPYGLNFGIFHMVINFLLYVFLYLKCFLLRSKGQELDAKVINWAVPAGAVSFVASYVGFVAALWGVFGLLSPAIMGILNAGLIMSFNFLPTFGLLSPAEQQEQPQGQQGGGDAPRKPRMRRHEHSD